MHMTFENIEFRQEGEVLVVTLNRPSQLNALNRASIAELSLILTQAEADSSVRVIIITGSGDKAFGAGADVKEFAHFAKDQGKDLSSKGHHTLFNKVEELAKPVIAAINGFALGGGLELAMACHIRIASVNAKLGLPEVTLGVIPGYGGTQRLPVLVGKGRAMELILTGSMIDAHEAYRIGLVNKVVTQDELMTVSMELAHRISRNSPNALKAAISSINAYSKDEGFAHEIDAFASCFGTGDFIEGTTAFFEKRKPQFAS
jgi:enoyl-CoA hydratase